MALNDNITPFLQIDGDARYPLLIDVSVTSGAGKIPRAGVDGKIDVSFIPSDDLIVDWTTPGTIGSITPNTGAFTRATIAAGAVADGIVALTVTSTLPNSSVTSIQKGVQFSITSGGSANGRQYGLNLDLLAGYTGGFGTVAFQASNVAAGIGATLLSPTQFGNAGGRFNATVTTVGINYGAWAAASGANLAIGLLGSAVSSKDNAVNIGVMGLGRNTGATPTQVGGYFGFNFSAPSFVSAALIADNADQTSSIFLARDNGSVVFTIADGGAVTGTGAAQFAALDNTPIGGTTPAAGTFLALAGSSLSIAPDTDATTILGRARFDSRFSDGLVLSHIDMTGNSYALVQTFSGATYLNSAAGQFIRFQIDGNSVAYVSSTGFGVGASPAANLHSYVSDTNTTSVVTGLLLDHDGSSGVGAAGMGIAIAFRSESSTSMREQGRIRTLWTTATDASRVSSMVLSVYNISTETDVLTLTPTAIATQIPIQSSGAANSTPYSWSRAVTGSPSGYTFLDTSQSSLGLIFGTTSGQIQVIASEVRIGSSSNHPVKLQANAVDVMTLTSAGRVLIGATDFGARLNVSGAAAGNMNVVIANNTYLGWRNAAGDANLNVLTVDVNNNVVFGLGGQFNGGITATTIGNVGSTLTVGTTNAQSLILRTNSINRIVIDSAGAIATTGPLTTTTYDAVTATVTNILTLQHETTGVSAAGYGTGLALQGKSSTTSNRDMARIRTLWTSATDASRSSSMILSTYDVGAERDTLTLSPVGSAFLKGISMTWDGSTILAFTQRNTSLVGVQGNAGGYSMNINTSTNRVGIGQISAPAAALHIQNNSAAGDLLVSLMVDAVASQSANLTEWRNSSGTVLASISGTGNVTLAPASGATTIYVQNTGTTGGSLSAVYGLMYFNSVNNSQLLAVAPKAVSAQVQLSGTSAVTHAVGARIGVNIAAAAALTNWYGIYVDDPVIAGGGVLTNNYAIYTNAGAVRFGGATTVNNANLNVLQTADSDVAFVIGGSAGTMAIVKRSSSTDTGRIEFQPATLSSPIVFTTVGGGNAALRIETGTASVGIGLASMTTIPGGKLDVAGDTDQTILLGRARIDSRASDIAYFSHFDQTGAGYALRQSASGETIINAPTGQVILLRTNNATDLANFSASSIQLNVSTFSLVTDAATATVTNVHTLRHETSGTPAAGYGTGLAFQGESSTTSNRDMARIRTLWTTATDASRVSQLRISAYDIGTERDGIIVTTQTGRAQTIIYNGFSTFNPVEGTNAGTMLVLTGSAETGAFNVSVDDNISFRNLSNTANNWMKFGFYSAVNNSIVGGFGFQVTDHTNAYAGFAIFTRGGVSGFSEKFRILEDGNVGIATATPTAKLDVNSDIIRLRTAKTPASAAAAGNQGDIAWDATYFYICVNTNQWQRVAHATW